VIERGGVLKVGYVALSESLEAPGDRRRFVAYARYKNIDFELACPSKIYDLVVITQLADISVWSNYPHGIVIYDLIDSYLAVPSSDFRQLFRGLFGFLKGRYKRLQFDHKSAIREMCIRSDAVICATEEQKKDVLRYCDNVHIILDTHNELVQEGKSDYSLGSGLELVWEGLPSNISHLAILAEVIEELSDLCPIVLNVITDPTASRYFKFLGQKDIKSSLKKISKHIIFHPFNTKTWSSIVRNCDVAVIPIDLNSPLARGKPENKMVLFWRMGIPVVTSATPAYKRAQARAGLSSEFACYEKSDWIRVLKKLIQEKDLRLNAGKLGQAQSNEEYSKEKILVKWDSLFNSLGVDF